METSFTLLMRKLHILIIIRQFFLVITTFQSVQFAIPDVVTYYQ